MKKNIYPALLVFIPLGIIFLVFFKHSYINLVRYSIIFFIALAVPYCFFVKDPRKGLLIFLIEASILEGAWKTFTYGTPLKLLVYMIRDLLLYASFLNFLVNRKRILSEMTSETKPPLTMAIGLSLFNLAISHFHPNVYSLPAALVGGRVYWEMMPLYVLGFYLMRDKKVLKIFFWVCVGCTFFNAIATILQYYWGDTRVGQIAPGYNALIFDWHRGYSETEGFQRTLRPPGLGSDMGFAGFLFWPVVPMFICLLFISRPRGMLKKKFAYIFLCCLCFIGISGLVFSLSRTAIVLSALVGITYLWLVKKDVNKILARLVLGAFLILFFLPYVFTKAELAAKRYQDIKTPKAIINTLFIEEKGRFETAFLYPLYAMQNYFFGNGLGRAGQVFHVFPNMPRPKTDTENSLNLSLTEIGAMGVFLLIFFQLRIIRGGFRILRHIKHSELSWYAAVPLSCMIILLTQWQFGHIINFPNNACLWFMAGVLMGIKHVQND
ncbi:MAG: hypothetical protein V2A72_02540 [Candidatus Omnitrophota bacterium]